MRALLVLTLALGGCLQQAGGSSNDTDATNVVGPSPDAGRRLQDSRVQVDGDPMATPDGGGPGGDGGSEDAGPDSGDPPDGPGPDMPVGPPPPECDDGEDNDGDGHFDLDDGDCSSSADPRESGGIEGAQCGNGLDDDEDDRIDFPNDQGCAAAGDESEMDTVFVPECVDGEDNDGDGRIDYPNDPGCQGRGDGTEADPRTPAACANGADDDGDGATDYPDDDGCEAAGDFSEIGPCGADAQVIDLERNGTHDGDLTGDPELFVGSCGGAAGGENVFRYRVERRLERLVVSTAHEQTAWPTVVYVRRACAAEADIACGRGPNQMEPGATLVLDDPTPGTYFIVVDTGSRNGVGAYRLTVEEIEIPACRDEVDNDQDGLIDAADPGCVEANDRDEGDPDAPPACSDGEDNDGDGATDYPADADCEFAGGPMEAPVCPGGPPTIPVGQQGGVFPLPAAMGLGGSEGSCDPVRSAEAVLVIDLDLPSDITVEVRDGEVSARLAMYARTDCNDPDTELACRASAQPDRPLVLEAVPRGRYYVLVELNFVAPGIARDAIVQIQSVITDCNDEVDNDGDGLVDLNDPGCEHGRDPSEADPMVAPQCGDGQDNDDDGAVDYPDDPGCDAAGDDDEADWRAPAVGLEGRVGVIDGDGWIVCRADDETAWVAANSNGNYQANIICQHLGYERADMWGGTCGTVCGYCNMAGQERYDNNGGNGDRLGVTVHWRCTRSP